MRSLVASVTAREVDLNGIRLSRIIVLMILGMIQSIEVVYTTSKVLLRNRALLTSTSLVSTK